MAVTPTTNLYLIAKNLPLSNKHQPTFANAEEQHNYFMTRYTVIGETDFTYQRQNSTIRYPANIDSLLIYKYCTYQNEAYGDKWFYAYITGMRYVNDNMTEITIKEDVFQTWQFDITYGQCFVEREMCNVADDKITNYREDEGLNLGEIELDPLNSLSLDTYSAEVFYYVIAYTGDTIYYNSTQIALAWNGANFNGLPKSQKYLICDNYTTYNTLYTSIQNNGLDSNITGVFITTDRAIPLFYSGFGNFGQGDYQFQHGISGLYIISAGTYNIIGLPSKLEFPTSLVDYVPRNKKLLQYPYTYLNFNSVNTGENKIYKYEDFDTEFIDESETKPYVRFLLYQELNPNGKTYFLPVKYKNADRCYPELVGTTLYPILPYTNDNFNLWYAQNSQLMTLNYYSAQNEYLGNESNLNANEITTVTTMAGDAFTTAGYLGQNAGLGTLTTGSLTEGVSKLATTIGNALTNTSNIENQKIVNKNNYDIAVGKIMANYNAQKLVADTYNAGNNEGLYQFGLSRKYIIARYSIRKEFAEKIDKYFDMFGYKVNTVKVPNTNNRPYWNYIKTQGSVIEGQNVPAYAITEIESMFDNGLTLWHHADSMYDYTNDNRTSTEGV